MLTNVTLLRIVGKEGASLLMIDSPHMGFQGSETTRLFVSILSLLSPSMEKKKQMSLPLPVWGEKAVVLHWWNVVLN